MSSAYKRPDLCNYYCSKECSIGQAYVPQIKISELSQIILHMLASLNSLERQKDRLIEITVDGKITTEEIRDFAQIQKMINQISMAADALRLWVDTSIANGNVDEETLKRFMNE